MGPFKMYESGKGGSQVYRGDGGSMAKCLEMLHTNDGQHLVIQKPSPWVTFPTTVVVSTLRTSVSWEPLNVNHACAGMGGLPGGRSSTCEQQDNCATLTYEECISPAAWDRQC